MKIDKSSKSKGTKESPLAGDLRMVALDLIVNHPDLEYRDLIDSHVDELVESIKANGLDTPITTWDGGEPDAEMKIKKVHYPASFLLAGQHRREALRRFRKEDSAGFLKRFPNEEIPTRIIHGDENEAIAAQLRENIARENPSLSDCLPFVQKLKDADLKSNKIAKMIGKSKSWVSEVLSIGEELGDEGVEAAKTGDLSIREARELKKKSKDAKKKGGKIDVKEEVAKIKAKKGGKARGEYEKKLSAKAVRARFVALPSLKMGKRLEIAEAALDYLAGEVDDLPEELQSDDEQESKPAKKGKK